MAAALISLGLRSRVASPQGRWQAIQEAVQQRRWDEAEALLSRWLEDSPGDGRARLMLGGLLGVRGRDDEARAALEQVKESDATWGQAQMLLGELALKRHDAPAAERAFRAAAARDRRAVDPRRRLAYLLLLQQRSEEARAVLWELYGLDPDPRHLVTLIGLSVVEPDARDLGPELDRFLERTPDDPWLQRARGLSLLRLGRLAEARPHLEAAATALEQDPTGRFALAECRILLGQTGAELDEALGPEPERPAVRARWWLLKGQAAEARSQAEQADECWRRAVEADPENRHAQYRLGQALVRRGQTESARAHLDRAEALRARESSLKAAIRPQGAGPRDIEAFEQLGRLCREAGLVAEAGAWYEQALRLDPSRRSVQVALAQIAVPPGQPAAIPRLRRGAATRPKAQAPRAPTAAEVRFEDVTRRAGLAFRYDSGAKGDLFIGDTMGGGVGLIDFDGDGWLDVYFVNGCRLPIDPESPPAPNKFFRNRRDGMFEDVTERAGVAGRGYGMGCAVGDYDADGHDDLFVTGLGSTRLYRNRGDGTFEDVTERAGVASERWTTAAGFGDLDGDGDLDLVAVAYVAADPGHVPDCRDQLNRPIHCPPGRFPAQFDHLFRNDGDGTFTDVSREAGLEVPEGNGLGLAIADFDGDDRLDLFVANDAVPSFLFRNLGELRFEEVALTSGVAYDGTGRATASMGVVADDLDGDGLIDLFHTNFNNEPNTLHRNLGGGLFADATAPAGLDAPSRAMTGFGTAALDVDNDGHLDLFVANGHVDDQPWFHIPMAQRPQLFLGRDGGRFVEAPAATAPYFGRPVVGRGAAAGDLDNDGRFDLVVVHRDAPAVLLRNTTAGGHWLSVRLRGTKSGRTPVGARVTCEAGGRRAVRWLTSGTSYLASNDPRIGFGLGSARRVDRLEVRWPSGAVQAWSNLPTDQILDLQEGDDSSAGAGPPRR